MSKCPQETGAERGVAPRPGSSRNAETARGRPGKIFSKKDLTGKINKNKFKDANTICCVYILNFPQDIGGRLIFARQELVLFVFEGKGGER
jgi:hypothetical protein